MADAALYRFRNRPPGPEDSEGAPSPNSTDTLPSPDHVRPGWRCWPGPPDLPPTLVTPVVSLPRRGLSTVCGRPVLPALPSRRCPHSSPLPRRPASAVSERRGVPPTRHAICQSSLIVTAYSCPHTLRNPHSTQLLAQSVNNPATSRPGDEPVTKRADARRGAPVLARRRGPERQAHLARRSRQVSVPGKRGEPARGRKAPNSGCSI